MRINAGGLSSIVIGREKEISTIKTYIELGQHCTLIAPRRYGKTTLVNNVLSALEKDYLIVKIDIFSASSVRELCNLLIDAVYHSIGVTGFIKDAKENIFDILSRFKLELEDVKIGYDILKEQDENEMINKAFSLTEIFAKKHKKKMVVFFDEFGDIHRFGNDLIKKLRSYFQQHSEVIYIFAGSQSSVMNNIFLQKDNAFFNFAAIMKLGKLPLSKVKEFIEQLVIQDVKFTQEASAQITEITKGHPFYMMKLIQESFVFAVIEKAEAVSELHINSGVDKILDDNNSYFENEWNNINNKKYKGLLLKQIIGIKIDETTLKDMNPSYRSQLQKELIDESVLDDSKKVVDPFMELWLSRNVL